MKLITLVLSGTLLFIGSTPELANGQDGKPNLPNSWEEFVEFHQNSGAFGTFSTQGETKDMWVGINGGQKYTATYTLELSDDQNVILSSHRMATENGQVISVGAGMQYWNAKSEKVMASYSGFDQGKLFSGQSKLRSMDPENKTIEWTYVEKSKGKSTTYIQTVTQTSRNTKVQTAKKKSGGDSWAEELTRSTGSGGRKSRRNFMPQLFRRQR